MSAKDDPEKVALAIFGTEHGAAADGTRHKG
jgi:hypothetical protein